MLNHVTVPTVTALLLLLSAATGEVKAPALKSQLIGDLGLRFSYPDSLHIAKSSPAPEGPGGVYFLTAGDDDDGLTISVYRPIAVVGLDELGSQLWHQFLDAGVKVTAPPRKERVSDTVVHCLELEFRGEKSQVVRGTVRTAVVGRYVISVGCSGHADEKVAAQLLVDLIAEARAHG